MSRIQPPLKGSLCGPKNGLFCPLSIHLSAYSVARALAINPSKTGRKRPASNVFKKTHCQREGVSIERCRSLRRLQRSAANDGIKYPAAPINRAAGIFVVSLRGDGCSSLKFDLCDEKQARLELVKAGIQPTSQ